MCLSKALCDFSRSAQYNHMCLLCFALLGITGQLISVVKEQDVTGKKALLTLEKFICYILLNALYG